MCKYHVYAVEVMTSHKLAHFLSVAMVLVRAHCAYTHTLHRIALTKFRCGNHRLPVVTGRFNGIERQNRICTLCNLNKIGDEFHYLFECPKLESNRKKYIKAYYRIRPNTFKMCQLFNSESSKELLNLAKFAKEIMKLHLT